MWKASERDSAQVLAAVHYYTIFYGNFLVGFFAIHSIRRITLKPNSSLLKSSVYLPIRFSFSFCSLLLFSIYPSLSFFFPVCLFGCRCTCDSCFSNYFLVKCFFLCVVVCVCVEWRTAIAEYTKCIHHEFRTMNIDLGVVLIWHFMRSMSMHWIIVVHIIFPSKHVHVAMPFSAPKNSKISTQQRELTSYTRKKSKSPTPKHTV